MDLKGKIENLYRDFKSGRWNILFSLDSLPPNCEDEFNTLLGAMLDIKVNKHREKRSLNANALLWKCLGEMAQATGDDKWDVYLQMLKKYGKFTYICVKPNVVEAMKKQWRECEEIGEIDIHGTKAVQMLCYFGSSTYDSKEFSVLLDGVISEMQQMGLTLPMPEYVEKALIEWEKHRGGGKNEKSN